VAWERVEEAQATGDAKAVDTKVRAALDHYQQALTRLPTDAMNDLSVAHNQLGGIYQTIGQIDAALPHYQQCIHLRDSSGDHYGAAQTRNNVALALVQAGRHRGMPPPRARPPPEARTPIRAATPRPAPGE